MRDRPLSCARTISYLFLLCFILAPVGVHAATLRGVQSGTAVCPQSGAVRVALPTAVDPSKSFLLFGSRHDDNEPTGAMVRGRIFSADSVEFVRVCEPADTSVIEIEWSVVEYSSGVRVQRGEVAQSAATVNVPLPVPVGAVNRAFVTLSKTPGAAQTAYAAPMFVLGQLTAPGNLQIRAALARSDNIISWQVVEFTDPADILVQSGSTSMTTATASVTATLGTAVDPAKTFLLVAYRSSAGGQDIGSRMLRAVLTNPTTITIDRSTTGDVPGDEITEIVWQAVELRDGSRVQGGSESFAPGQNLRTVAVSSFDTSRSVAFSAVQPLAGQSLGRSPFVTDDILGVGSFTMRLATPTQLEVRRRSTASTSDVGWFLVEFGDVADLEIAKAVSDPTPDEGDPIAYTVTLTNTGPEGATGVQVTDLLPAGVTFQSFSATQGTYTDGTGLWDVGAIANAGSAVLTLNATVDPGTGGTTIDNVATITASDQTDPEPGNDSASVRVWVQGANPDEFQVTSGAASDQRPAWSPDGASLVFDTDVTGNPDLWVVPSVGGAATQLTTAPLLDRHPDWSPDGTTIVYSSRDGNAPNPDLWLVPSGGGTPTLLFADPVANEEFPVWSPDGSQVAFSSAGDIWVIPSGGGTPVQVTTDPADDVHPTWSPDGTRLAFLSDRSGNNDLWIVPATGGPATRVTTDPANDSAPDWSPDGTRLAFQSTRAGNTDIWVIPATGGVARRITTHAGIDVQPDWSPSGDRLAFARDGDLWIYTFPIDLAVTKAVDDPSPAPGDVVTYTVTVTNGGPKPATGVAVTDLLPAGVTFQSATPSQGTYTDGTGLWSVGTIPFGASATLTLVGTVDLATGGATIVNTASVSASNEADRDPTNDSASASITVRKVLAISSANDQSFFMGDPPTAVAVIRITDDDLAASVTAANDLRVRIPPGLAMGWDVTDVTATIGGPAASKVSPTVTYEDASRTLVLDVTADFAPGDEILVSDVAFASFTAPSGGSLELEVGNDNLVSAVDDKTITIVDPVDAPAVSGVPTEFALSPGRPNPFRESTTISFDMPVAGSARLELFDVAGRHVRTLVAGEVPAGRHVVTWDGRNDQGGRVSVGVYFARLEAGTFAGTRKVIRLR